MRHVVLLSHLGYEADKKIAPQLTDVDVIIGGDSHSLLGDFASVGISTASGAYPTVVTNKSGETVCIGQAWEYAKAYGLMNVKFDDRGSVSQCGGTAKLVIGDNFKRKDSAGAWQTLAEHKVAQAPVVDERAAAQTAKERLYALRRDPRVREEADAIQQRHGSRRSGLNPGTRQTTRPAKRRHPTPAPAPPQLSLFPDA